MEKNSTSKKPVLILVGGGHAHAVVLRDGTPEFFSSFEIHLVSPNGKTDYSGMMTGYLAGIYKRDSIQIDIEKLCNSRGVRFHRARAKALRGSDLELAGGAEAVVKSGAVQDRKSCSDSCSDSVLRFDYLSIDTGSESDLSEVNGAAKNGYSLRPFGRFVKDFQGHLSKFKVGDRMHVVQIGGGAAGCETAACLLAATKRHGIQLQLSIIERGSRLIPEASDKLSEKFLRYFESKQVSTYLNCSAEEIHESKVSLSTGIVLKSDFTSLALPPRAGKWLEASDLELDDKKFVRVNEFLQTSNPRVFAVGDVAVLSSRALPRAGVFAVRQAPVLAQNLLRAAKNSSLTPFKPQKSWLALFNDGEGKAFGYRGKFTFPHARLTWQMKDWIDQRFIRSFR